MIFYTLSASPYYACGMKAAGLPARIVYAVVALPVGGAAGFYGSIWLVPKLAQYLFGIDRSAHGLDMFTLCVGIGAAAGFTAFLVGLTLPWKRKRRRTGRDRRIVMGSAFVVMVSAGFSTQHHAIGYDLAFAAWLAYTVAYTFVRYGVFDAGSSSAKDFIA